MSLSKMPSLSPRRRIRVCKYKSPTKTDCFYLRAGDHIYRPIRYCMGATHHGIYIGNGEVIHFTGPANNQQQNGGIFDKLFGSDKSLEEQLYYGDPFESAQILQTSFEEFMSGYPLEDLTVVEYNGPTLSRKKVVKKAIELKFSKEYHLLYNNCEHFAAYCKTDRKSSQQAINAFNKFLPRFLKRKTQLYDL